MSWLSELFGFGKRKDQERKEKEEFRCPRETIHFSEPASDPYALFPSPTKLFLIRTASGKSDDTDTYHGNNDDSSVFPNFTDFVDSSNNDSDFGGGGASGDW